MAADSMLESLTGLGWAHSQSLGCAMLLAVLDVAHTWPTMGVCVELVMVMAIR